MQTQVACNCVHNTTVLQSRRRLNSLGIPFRREYNTPSYGADVKNSLYVFHSCRDTIRDAILACARKPTWVSLNYRTEPATKECKAEKLKSKNRVCSEVTVNSPGESVESVPKKKRKAAVGRICNSSSQNLLLFPIPAYSTRLRFLTKHINTRI